MSSNGKVALFVTCLADVYRPSIAFSAIKLLKQCGYDVEVPLNQTCCGQPNYNGGDRKAGRKMAKRTLEVFADYEYIVTVSGSCGGMLIKHYPLLFQDDPVMENKARLFADKVFELSMFLTEIGRFEADMKAEKKITYHDSCAGLRELGVKDQPRELLRQIIGLNIIEMQEPEVCCGFGGVFSIKYPEISNSIVTSKVTQARDTGADCLVAGDLGCILNMEGKLNRLNSPMPVYHYAELLADSIVEVHQQ